MCGLAERSCTIVVSARPIDWDSTHHEKPGSLSHESHDVGIQYIGVCPK